MFNFVIPQILMMNFKIFFIHICLTFLVTITIKRSSKAFYFNFRFISSSTFQQHCSVHNNPLGSYVGTLHHFNCFLFELIRVLLICVLFQFLVVTKQICSQYEITCNVDSLMEYAISHGLVFVASLSC